MTRNQDFIPEEISALYQVMDWRNGLAILSSARRSEFDDMLEVLRDFRLLRSEIVSPGGSKSDIAKKIDNHFTKLGWVEKQFKTRILVDDASYDAPTHKVDCYKNRIALEVEWNNKDPFFDRDLNNFRLLFDLRAIDVGVIITRATALQNIFNQLGKGSSYGNSTTHLDKLIPRLEGGGGGGCPVVVFAISPEAYVDNG
jgi:hypothetical protein